MHPGITQLAKAGTIRRAQAAYIHDNWADSPGDLWAQPMVRDVRDHTRCHIDQLRGQFRAAIPFEEQEGGEVHG